MISHEDLFLYLGEIRSLQDDIDELAEKIHLPAPLKEKIISYERRKNDVLNLIFNELDLNI